MVGDLPAVAHGQSDPVVVFLQRVVLRREVGDIVDVVYGPLPGFFVHQDEEIVVGTGPHELEHLLSRVLV